LYLMAPDIAGAEPRRMSLYMFSLNNPLRYLDPDGRDAAGASAARKTGKFLWDLVAGGADAEAEAAKGLGSAVANPKKTVKGLVRMVTHPAEAEEMLLASQGPD